MAARRLRSGSPPIGCENQDEPPPNVNRLADGFGGSEGSLSSDDTLDIALRYGTIAFDVDGRAAGCGGSESATPGASSSDDRAIV